MALRWGIVGSGKICHDFTTGLATLPKSEHQVVAIAARDLQRAQNFAKLHEIPNAYQSYQQIANDQNVEIVYIGTLHPSHLEVGKMMLNAGKHVLCEKPLTMNYKQTKELIDLAEKKNLFLMEAIWSRCFPAYDTLREELAKKSIGEVKQVVASLGFKISQVERLNTKKLGGGVILDMGVYVIQFASLVFGHEKPESIKAVGHLNEESVDDSMSALLSYSNGRTATIISSSTCQLPNEAYVIGTEGTIHVPNFWCPTTIKLPDTVKEVLLPPTKLKLNYFNSAGLRYEAMEARKCVNKGLTESPKIKHAHSLLIAEIQDELRRQIGVVYDEDK